MAKTGVCAPPVPLAARHQPSVHFPLSRDGPLLPAACRRPWGWWHWVSGRSPDVPCCLGVWGVFQQASEGPLRLPAFLWLTPYHVQVCYCSPGIFLISLSWKPVAQSPERTPVVLWYWYFGCGSAVVLVISLSHQPDCDLNRVVFSLLSSIVGVQ